MWGLGGFFVSLSLSLFPLSLSSPLCGCGCVVRGAVRLGGLRFGGSLCWLCVWGLPSLSLPLSLSLSLVWGHLLSRPTSDKKMRISIGEIRTVCEPAPLGHGGVRLLSHTASSPSSLFFGLGGFPLVSLSFPPCFSSPAGDSVHSFFLCCLCVCVCVCWGPACLCGGLGAFLFLSLSLSFPSLSPLLSAGAGVWCVVRCVLGVCCVLGTMAPVCAQVAHLAEVIHGDQPRNRRVREAADEPLVLQLGNDLLQRRHFELGGGGLVSLYSRRGVQSPKNEARFRFVTPRRH